MRIYRTIALSFFAGVVLNGSTARASVIFNFQQVGSDVVATGSGSINTAALVSSFNQDGYVAFERSGFAMLLTGSSSPSLHFTSTMTGPDTFGSASIIAHLASFSTGDDVGVEGVNGNVWLPIGYVSGAPLSGTTTWLNQTFSTLELTPGVYVELFGSGPSADSFTISIGQTVAAAPEPSTVALLSVPAVLVLLRRRRASVDNGGQAR